MNLIQNTIQSFNRVALADLDQVKLMDRIDHKYCLHRLILPLVLDSLKSHYSVLEIDGETIFPYNNTYFDTLDDQMYLCHHNGNGKRFKIRVRQYVQSKDNFLEIKLKNNKGRTKKERIGRMNFDSIFGSEEIEFLQKTSPFQGSQLYPKIHSNFKRITLVNNQFTERVTIDLYPGFENQGKNIVLENLVIIEIKQNKSKDITPITQVLKENKIQCQGFSKYCIGRSLLDENIKKNNFKPLLIKLKKEYSN
jgi:hypothetical protein